MELKHAIKLKNSKNAATTKVRTYSVRSSPYLTNVATCQVTTKSQKVGSFEFKFVNMLVIGLVFVSIYICLASAGTPLVISANVRGKRYEITATTGNVSVLDEFPTQNLVFRWLHLHCEQVNY